MWVAYKSKEARNAASRAHYQANKEKQAEYGRAWRAANREKVAAQKRTYYQANKEKRATYCREYNLANRWIRKSSECRRSNTPFNLPREFFDNVPTQCPQCGVMFVPVGDQNAQPSIDRDDPALGYVVGNCEWICRTCNRRKDNQSWADLLEFAQRGLARKMGS